MPSSRIYLGRMPYRATERDIEDFFRGYGKITDIMVKTGFAFIEFADPRDADDAAHDLNGRTMMNERSVSVEVARGTPRGRDSFDFKPRFDDRRGGGGRDRRPERSDYRLLVHNLSTRIGWQELKDLFRDCGEVCYADAHTRKRNEGLLEFVREKDMHKALDKMQGKEFNGREIELKEDDYTKKRRRSKSRSRSRSRSRSGSRRRSRSRSSRRSSRSASPKDKVKKEKRSKSRSASRSASPTGKRSASPSKRSASPEAKREKTIKDEKEASASPAHNGGDKSKSPSPAAKDKSRSPSPKSD